MKQYIDRNIREMPNIAGSIIKEINKPRDDFSHRLVEDEQTGDLTTILAQYPQR